MKTWTGKTVMALAICLMLPASANALPQSLCRETVIQQGKVQGILTATQVADNRGYAVMELKNGEEFTIPMPYDMLTGNAHLRGRKVEAGYKVVQYWDEQDGECVRDETLTAIKPLD